MAGPPSRADGTGAASGRSLLPHHEQLIADSAISPDVARERGYWTATNAIELRRLGFSTVQAITPALIIPIRDTGGELVSYQARPDQPRIGDDGRPMKYESPVRSSIVLDVPARARDRLKSTIVPLWLTEGSRKADSAVSAGLCCVAVLGVASWNVLHRIKLDERQVIVAFDSDVMTKPAVHGQLTKLAAWLESQGAHVHCLHLPASDGEKVGLDDFLASHGVEELWEYVEEGVRAMREKPQQTVLPTMWLLGRIEAFLRRFVRFTDERSDAEVCALALYVLHTWAFDAAYATPYIYVRSPAKRAGKSRLLEVLEAVCRNPVRASSITAAAVFQLVEAKRPTLLIDEVDALFGGRAGRTEQAEALRGVLNDGFHPAGAAIRGTQDGEPRIFSTWSPKVLAGIDNSTLPDTVQDRSVMIGLERKLKGDPVDRFRKRDVDTQLARCATGYTTGRCSPSTGWPTIR